MKTVVFILMFLVATVATVAWAAAIVDKDAIAKERRTQFLEQFKDRPEELKHIQEGLQAIRMREKQKKQNFRISSQAQKFALDRQQLHQQLDQNSSDLASPSIITNNEGLEEFLYQSDILLTPMQVDQMVNDNGNSRQKRQATSGIYRKWNKTTPIYFNFDPKFNASYANVMRLSADFWERNTCLNIVESDATPNIRVFHGSGCFSNLGYIGRATQDLSLGSGCGWFGIAAHELAHALGFWHEQSRYDRDSYITVDTANMDDFFLRNWEKESPASNENYGRPYDWGSVMHYAASEKIGSPIFAIASDKIYQSTMGSRSGPSFQDVYEMNLHYDCMCASGAKCQNGGFPHPRNCSICICPSGFGGAVCDQLQASENGAANIGEVLASQESFQTLTAKTGDPSKILDKPQVVHWHIIAPTGKQIEITVESVAGQCAVGCFWGSLEIKVRNFDLVGSRFCCASDIAANPKLVSAENFAIVSLYSQAYQHSFTLKYRYIDPPCSNSTTTSIPVTPSSPTSDYSTASPPTTSDATSTSTTPTNTPTQTLPSTPTSTVSGATSTTTTPTSKVTPTPTNNGTCVDKFDDCQRYLFAKREYCDDETYAGQQWMLENCAKFCNECGAITTPPCFDLYDECYNFAHAKNTYCFDETYLGQAWIHHHCKKFCGVCTDSAPIISP